MVTLGNSELGDVEHVNVHVFSIAGKKQCVEEFHCMLTWGEDGRFTSGKLHYHPRVRHESRRVRRA